MTSDGSEAKFRELIAKRLEEIATQNENGLLLVSPDWVEGIRDAAKFVRSDLKIRKTMSVTPPCEKCGHAKDDHETIDSNRKPKKWEVCWGEIVTSESGITRCNCDGFEELK